MPQATSLWFWWTDSCHFTRLPAINCSWRQSRKVFYNRNRNLGVPLSKRLQQTPGTYRRPSTTCLWRKSFHVCILGYLGYVPGVCWNFPRHWSFRYPHIQIDNTRKKNMLWTPQCLFIWKDWCYKMVTKKATYVYIDFELKDGKDGNPPKNLHHLCSIWPYDKMAGTRCFLRSCCHGREGGLIHMGWSFSTIDFGREL